MEEDMPQIRRTVLGRHPYGYCATPGRLLVDVAQGDPAAALITNRTGRTVSITLLGALGGSDVALVPESFRLSPEAHARLRGLIEFTPVRGSIGLEDGRSLALAFPESLAGVQSYQAAVDGTDVEVSGGSGPGIIIER
jgi:hypothetical protein